LEEEEGGEGPIAHGGYDIVNGLWNARLSKRKLLDGGVVFGEGCFDCDL
jgi:hypothetical protein